jgi:L-lactate dehydrogenase
LLDSLRFRVHLAQHFEVDANQVEAQVVGEHGVSQVFLWSSARIAGVPIGALIRERGETIEKVREQIDSSVRYANITIIEGNDASQFGIGIVSARIAEIVLRDERAVLPIGSYNDRFGVTLSVPRRSKWRGSDPGARDVIRRRTGAQAQRRRLEEVRRRDLRAPG